MLDETGLSLTRFEQHLRSLLDHPAALLHAPATVRRLQRLQEQRRERRQRAA